MISVQSTPASGMEAVGHAPDCMAASETQENAVAEGHAAHSCAALAVNALVAGCVEFAANGCKLCWRIQRDIWKGKGRRLGG